MLGREDWEDWSGIQILQAIIDLDPRVRGKQAGLVLADALEKDIVPVDTTSKKSTVQEAIWKSIFSLKQVLSAYGVHETAMAQRLPLDRALQRLLQGNIGVVIKMKADWEDHKETIAKDQLTWQCLVEWLQGQATAHKDLQTAANNLGYELDAQASADRQTRRDNSDHDNDRSRRRKETRKQKKQEQKGKKCYGCNTYHPQAAECPHKDKPGYNNSGLPWSQSEIGKKAAAHRIYKLPDLTEEVLRELEVERSETKPGDKERSRPKTKFREKSDRRSPAPKGTETKPGEFPCIASISSTPPSSTPTSYPKPPSSGPYILTRIVSPLRSGQEQPPTSWAYIDSGAEAGNCVSRETLDRLKDLGVDIEQCMKKSKTVHCACGVIGKGSDACSCSDDLVTLTFKFLPPPECYCNKDFVNKEHTMTFKVLDIHTRLSLVIGYDTIRDQDLTSVFHYLFAKPATENSQPTMDEVKTARIAAIIDTVPTNYRDPDVGSKYARVHRDELLTMAEGCADGEENVFWRETLNSELLSDSEDGSDAEEEQPTEADEPDVVIADGLISMMVHVPRKIRRRFFSYMGNDSRRHDFVKH